MNVVIPSASIHRRRRPLALALASLFALSAPLSSIAATTWIVDSCDGDSVAGSGPGSGSLRYAVAHAASGDTVDLSGLTGQSACASSKISLTTGEIYVPQTSLIIKGPGETALTIDASGNPAGGTNTNNSRVFTHQGTGGTLEVEYLTLTGGHSVHGSFYRSLGGCIYSASTVTLLHATVTGCNTLNYGSLFTTYSLGGGVYTKGNLNLKYSTLSNNDATSVYSEGTGGGAEVLGNFSSKYSTVKGNTATSRGGGLFLAGGATIATSTISNNSATYYGGIDAFSGSPAGVTFQLGNSTVSGNSATSNSGGLYVNSGTVKFYNSTIAFNTAASNPGVLIHAGGAVAATLQSTLMSNNSSGSTDNDLTIQGGGGVTFNGGDLVTPANNLIRATAFKASLPNDTTVVSCPLLAPLRDNGGLTQTHQLGSSSFAIDHGNTNRSGGVNYDQRGPATANGEKDYVRTSGPAGDLNPKPDIGAFEVQQNDELFLANFDGCNLLL